MKPILYIPIGPSGSGKSTWARDFQRLAPSTDIIATDDIRLEVSGDANDQSQNMKVFEIAYERVASALRNGHDVIFDATNLTYRYRKKLIREARRFNTDFDVYIINFITSEEECIARQSLRERKVPVDVIHRQFGAYQAPRSDEYRWKLDWPIDF